jgi:glyoxylase-like metal-dependent hydrolase (beta-lactamase superfamily II)
MPREVHVLHVGYSRQCGGGQMEANAISTLVRGDKTVVVDTLTAWDGPLLREALAARGVRCEEVDYVVCTHGHSDHVGNDNLFLNATHVVGLSVSKGTTYSSSPGFSLEIEEGVTVVVTPGHTLDSVSVLVATEEGRVAVVGDLFEREEDIADPALWRDVAGS